VFTERTPRPRPMRKASTVMLNFLPWLARNVKQSFMSSKPMRHTVADPPPANPLKYAELFAEPFQPLVAFFFVGTGKGVEQFAVPVGATSVLGRAGPAAVHVARVSNVFLGW